MDETLKEKVKELGLAISSALSDTESIAEAIAAIKESGYDVFLVLEATIGLSRKTPLLSETETTFSSQAGEIQLNITPSDKQFLKALRIKLDEVTTPEVQGSHGE